MVELLNMARAEQGKPPLKATARMPSPPTKAEPPVQHPEFGSPAFPPHVEHRAMIPRDHAGRVPGTVEDGIAVGFPTSGISRGNNAALPTSPGLAPEETIQNAPSAVPRYREPQPSVTRGVICGAALAAVCYSVILRLSHEGWQVFWGLIATTGAGALAQALSGPPCPKWRGGQVMALLVGAYAALAHGYQAGIVCLFTTIVGVGGVGEEQYRFTAAEDLHSRGEPASTMWGWRPGLTRTGGRVVQLVRWCRRTAMVAWLRTLGLRHVQGACLIAVTLTLIWYLVWPRYVYEPIGQGYVVLKRDRWTGEVWSGQVNRGVWIQLPYSGRP